MFNHARNGTPLALSLSRASPALSALPIRPRPIQQLGDSSFAGPRDRWWVLGEKSETVRLRMNFDLLTWAMEGWVGQGWAFALRWHGVVCKACEARAERGSRSRWRERQGTGGKALRLEESQRDIHHGKFERALAPAAHSAVPASKPERERGGGRERGSELPVCVRVCRSNPPRMTDS